MRRLQVTDEHGHKKSLLHYIGYDHGQVNYMCTNHLQT